MEALEKGVKSGISHLEGHSGYKCVQGKGHLDNCKDPNGVCETNSICRFIDDVKRRGKLDKTDIIYSEANNIENGSNARSSFELVFKLDYDVANGQRVTLELISPTVYDMDVDKYKYSTIMKMLNDTIAMFIDKGGKYSMSMSNPYDIYSLVNKLIFKNDKKLYKLKTALTKEFSPMVLNSVKEQIDHIIKHGNANPFNRVLTVDDINDGNIYSIIKSFISNIKNDLIREYKSPNRHIIPPLNPSFVASVDKQVSAIKIEYPEVYSGGYRKRHTRVHHDKKKNVRGHKTRRSR